MTAIQKLILNVLPNKLAEDIKAESQQWIIRCCTCGASRSFWEAGGIRWKAFSIRKRTVANCSKCGGSRKASIEKAA